MENFEEELGLLTDVELLHIINNPDKHGKDYVKAADRVFKGRWLSREVPISTKTEDTTDKQQNPPSPSHAIYGEPIDDVLWNKHVNQIEDISTESTENSATEKIISILSPIVVMFSAIIIYFQADGLKQAFKSEESPNLILITLYITNFLILPLGGILLWIRKKTGWIFLNVYFTNSMINSIIMMLLYVISETYRQQYTWGKNLESIVVAAGLIYFLSRKNVRKIYNTNMQTMWLTIGITAIVTVLIFLSGVLKFEAYFNISIHRV